MIQDIVITFISCFCAVYLHIALEEIRCRRKMAKRLRKESEEKERDEEIDEFADLCSVDEEDPDSAVYEDKYGIGYN